MKRILSVTAATIAICFIRGGVKPRPSRRGYKPPLQGCLLLLDVRLQNTDWCATTTGSEIRRRPENTLPVTAC
jgi:hypothetical protein